MSFSKAELSRWTDEARPIIARLTDGGCRFVQLELPDINGILHGKLVSLSRGFSAAGTGIGTVILTMKGGGQMSLAPPFTGGPESGFAKMVAAPDLSTAIALPWKQDVAAVLCDYYMNDGSPCELSPRRILRCAEAELEKLGYSVHVGIECEFYIVEQNDALMREGRFAELLSFQRGVDMWSLQKSPSFEDLAKEFMTRCETAGIPIETFHTEHGHGMFEYSLAPQTAVKAADDTVRAKLYMKQLCSERGLAATFMAAKSFAVGDSFTGDTFSGWHHNFSLARGTENAFWDSTTRDLSSVARRAAAGMLESMPAFSIIYRPWVNSYRRLNHHLGAPENASWGKEHHLAAIRVVHGAAPERLTRFEHRVPGADVNPYLTIATLVYGCLRGIQKNLDPPAYATGDVMLEKNGVKLPRTMPEAIEMFRKSPFSADAFGAPFVENLALLKEEEWTEFGKAVASPEAALQKGPVTNWEYDRYFYHT